MRKVNAVPAHINVWQCVCWGKMRLSDCVTHTFGVSKKVPERSVTCHLGRGAPSGWVTRAQPVTVWRQGSPCGGRVHMPFDLRCLSVLSFPGNLPGALDSLSSGAALFRVTAASRQRPLISALKVSFQCKWLTNPPPPPFRIRLPDIVLLFNMKKYPIIPHACEAASGT